MHTFNTSFYQSAHIKVKILIFFAAFLFIFSANSALAATLSVSPNTGVYTAGATFTARVVVNTQGKPINAAEGSLSYDPSKLSVVGVSKGSVFSLWTTEPKYSNSGGTITFGGGSPSGYTGSAGSIMNVTFRTKTAGKSKVTFKTGSVLAADGKGTNILTSMNGGTFTIVAATVAPVPEEIEYIAPANTPGAPSITSATHSPAEGWYTSKSATLSWTLPSGITGVRTLLDEHSGSIPTKVYDTPISTITIDELDEGEQYFHMQFRNGDGWGRVAHYRLAVDSEKPSTFTISLVENADLSNPAQTLLFEIEDATSGIQKYLVQIDGGDPFEYLDSTGSSTMVLPELDPGHHSVIIEAFDYAGNSLISTFSFNILAFDKPQFTEYPNEMNQEVIPVIKGITRPDSSVTVSVTRVGFTGGALATDDTYVMRSDSSGEFIFIPEGTFNLGVYELVAVATDVHGAQSEPSDSIRIAVQEPGYVQIGAIALSVMSVVVPIFALLLLALFALIYFLRRVRLIRKYVTRETDEALSILESEFDALRRVVTIQKEELSKSRKSGKLTKGETTVVDSFTKALKSAEKKIKDEISDVDDVVE